MIERDCLYCHSKLTGRSDQKFCSDQCRANFNNQHKKEHEKLILSVNKVLRKNRSILKQINPKGKSTVKKQYLLNEGFNFNYFTSVYESQQLKYRFCYEYGYAFSENEEKVIIINWQKYMKGKATL